MPSPAPVRPARKASYHHGDLACALVDAAWRLIESNGHVRLTLRDTAQAAGVSSAAPYRHFADRDALLAAVLARGFRDLAQLTRTAQQAAPDPMAALLAVGLAYVRFAADHPAIYRLMFGPECDKSAHPDLLAAGHEALSVLLGAVQRCQACGLIRGHDAGMVALAGWALSHGLASLHADGILAATLPGDLGAMARMIVPMLIDGIRAPPTSMPLQGAEPGARSHSRFGAVAPGTGPNSSSNNSPGTDASSSTISVPSSRS